MTPSKHPVHRPQHRHRFHRLYTALQLPTTSNSTSTNDPGRTRPISVNPQTQHLATGYKIKVGNCLDTQTTPTTRSSDHGTITTMHTYRKPHPTTWNLQSNSNTNRAKHGARRNFNTWQHPLVLTPQLHSTQGGTVTDSTQHAGWPQGRTTLQSRPEGQSAPPGSVS